jgi:hypothetical protein
VDYMTWRDLVTAYVRVRASAAGWVVLAVRPSKSSESLYIDLQRGQVAAVIRVSDHRPHRSMRKRESMFSVRRGATLGLNMLDGWLFRRFQSVRNA